MADNVVETILVKLGLDSGQYNAATDKVIKKNETLNKSVGQTDKVVGTVAKTMGRWFAGIASATGVAKLIDEVQKLNDELYHLEKNLGMSSTTIKAWQGAAGAMGGSADGMTSSMKSLNMAMNDFVVMGDSSMLPYMNALGVSMVDAQGKLRDTDKVMLDLADSFSKMDREQAFSLATKMGIDEGTFNTLVQGRQEMEKMIEYQKTMYKSSEAELKASRDLAKNRALLGQHWESMKTLMANALIPFFVKLSEVALGMFDYLQKHQKAIQAVFKGIAFVVGVVLTPILVKATMAALAFMAPFAPFILVVGALGAAFGLLYDDYKAWAEGGNSLFNWGAFSDYIDNAKISTENLTKGFTYLLTGYNTWSEAAQDGKAWLKLKGFIDENGVSLKTLREGFLNLASDIVKYAIPTLQGYAEIFQKLINGDFKGAAAQALDMTKNMGQNIIDAGKAVWDRVSGAVDAATGQPSGTLSGVGLLSYGQGGGATGGKTSSGFTADKAKTIEATAKRLGIKPNDLASIISFETGGTFNTNARNPTSSATGLIQFMKGSGGTKGKYYGMSRDQFGGLSFDEQMKYVEKYFKDRGFDGKKQRSVADAYTAVTGYGYKRGTEAYDLNKVWDSNNNGVIEKGEMVQNPSFKAHQKDYFPTGAAAAQSSMRQGTGSIPSNMQSASRNVRNDVNIGDINVYTTASTIKGTTTDAMTAATNQLGMLMPSMA